MKQAFAIENLALALAASEGIEVRPAAPGDEYECANVRIHSWREAYAGLVDGAFLDALPIHFSKYVENWRGIIESNNGAHTLVASRQGTIVGFARVGPSRDADFPNQGELWSLYLLRACHGRKVGCLLLAEGMRRLWRQGFRSAHAWVLAGNPTRRFYEKMGARHRGEIKTVEIGGRAYEEIAMTWDDLSPFGSLLASPFDASQGRPA